MSLNFGLANDKGESGQVVMAKAYVSVDTRLFIATRTIIATYTLHTALLETVLEICISNEFSLLPMGAANG